MRVTVVDQDAERRFLTYSHFLEQMVRCSEASALPGRPVHEGLVAVTRARPRVQRIGRRSLSPDLQQAVSKSLRLSWAMEAQLVMREQHDPDLLPDLLQGAPADAYYAVYHAIRALLLVGQSDAPADHSGVLKAWSNLVTNRDVVPTLWRVRVVGRPGAPSCAVQGAPVAVNSGRNQLGAPHPAYCWDDAVTALRTTRERQLSHRRGEWLKSSKRDRLPAGMAEQLATKLLPTTMADFLWRLRTHSHYRGAEMFLGGVSSSNAALVYHHALRELTSATVTVVNAVTLAYAGRSALESAANSFSARRNVEVYRTFHERWQALTS